jgi:peptidoglycan/xylan/chitin deacetylase (PgdA/CDA1 family)
MRGYSSLLQDGAFVIFLFHGVIRAPRGTVRNYTSKHLLQDRFTSVLRELISNGVPVSMDGIVEATSQGIALPDRAFAITFDDGFENNYSVAAPILRDQGIPATFYITTGFIDTNSLSWIDMIEQAVETAADIHLDLDFVSPDRNYRTREDRIELLDRIRTHVKAQPAVDPYVFASEVCRQLNAQQIVPDPCLDQKMSWDQVRALHQDPLFTIGGHSHTHRILSFLDPSELEREISVSLKKLRDGLGAPVAHYSYPEGLAHCYSEEVIAELQRQGVACAPTAETGVNRVGDDLFRLKRVSVT